jgi:hypothetical protein
MIAAPLNGKEEAMKPKEIIENISAILLIGALVFAIVAIASNFPMIKEYLYAFVISIRNWLW